MYSQNNEEEVILNYFKDFKGRFLDIGAWDGKTFSNTHALANLGWSGVCLEPSPTSCKALKELYKDNKKIVCLEIGLSSGQETSRKDFYDSNGDAISTTEIEHTKKWGNVTFNKISIEIMPIDRIMMAFGDHYDMVNLDVESTNIEMLYTLPLDRMGVKLICVEYDGNPDAVINYCNGFKEISRNGENIIMAR